MKKCSACKIEKPLSGFRRNRTRKDGLNNNCAICEKERRKIYHLKNKETENFKNRQRKIKYYKDGWYLKNREKILAKARERNKRNPSAHKNWLLKNKYGINLLEYEKILTKQNMTCAICKKHESALDKKANKTKNLSVDHSHATGLVRGLLCGKCNTLIGLAKEDKEVLNSAIKYLISYGG